MSPIGEFLTNNPSKMNIMETKNEPEEKDMVVIVEDVLKHMEENKDSLFSSKEFISDKDKEKIIKDLLFFIGKQMKHLSDNEKVISLRQYLDERDISVDLMKNLLAWYSSYHNLEFTQYPHSFLIGLFAGGAIVSSLMSFLEIRNSVLMIILSVIALGVCFLEWDKRKHLRKITFLKCLLLDIELKNYIQENKTENNLIINI